MWFCIKRLESIKIFFVSKIFWILLLMSAIIHGQNLNGFDSEKNYELNSVYDNLLISLLSQKDSTSYYAKELQKTSEKNQDLIYYHLANEILKADDDNWKKKAIEDLIKSLLKQEQAQTRTIRIILAIGTKNFEKRDFKSALNFYLCAHYLSRKIEDKKLIYFSNHSIGILKNRIGDFSHAFEIHNDNLKLLNDDNSSLFSNLNKLATLFSLSISCRNLDKVSLAEKHNENGKQIALKEKNLEMANLFLQHESIINYEKNNSTNNIRIAIDSLLKATRYFESENLNPDLAISYFFLGRMNLDLDNKSKAVNYFKKVDSIFDITKDIHPEAVPAYGYLIRHFRNENDFKNQLFYVNKNLEVDSLVKEYKTYLKNKITIEYDIPNLIEERDGIIKKQRTKEKYYYTLIVVLILILLMTFYLYRKKQKIYKKQFDSLINNNTSPKEAAKTEKNLDVPEEIVQSILEGLKVFEKNKNFKNKKTSLNSLSKELKTNSSYLSKVINAKKDKSFSKYVNDLRLDYALKKLKESEQFRNYKISAIARDVGFGNTETFSKLFKDRFGLYVSYFIKELNKKII